MRKIYFSTLLLLSFVFLTVTSLNNCTSSAQGPKPIDGLVTGYVYTEVLIRGKERPKKVFLPDVLVTIKDASGAIVATDTTDLDGGYRTKDIKKGKYRISFSKSGYDLTSYELTVQYATNHPGQLKINFKGNDYIYGTAKLADGFPAVFRNEVFGVDFFTTVSVDSNRANAVRCNISGEFILRGVSRNGRFGITASCQSAETRQAVQADGSMHLLVFKNTKPVIQYIVAYDEGGKAVLRTLPSAKLKIVANTMDGEGHSLTYMWMPNGAYPGSSFTNNREALWQMTSVKAINSVTLLVLDNYGGTSYKTYSIEDNDGRVAFSGVVQNIDGSGVIQDATVRINGLQVAKTSSKGTFSVRVNEAENNRYVLNIEKPGYMLSSSIFQKEAHAQTYSLVKATTRDFDPALDIVITEEQDKYTKFVTIDTNRERRTRVAASIKIPAGSITDSNGNKVVSAVSVQLRTIDLYDRQGLMPGDYAAIENGADKTLVSFGAIDVQIRDKANPEIRYNINEQARADVNIPISSDLLARAPANITLWDYNEITGIWDKITTVAKVGNRYVGTTNRFSSINTDVAITDGTCIYLQDNLNNPIFPGSDCDVTITIPTSGAPRIKHTTISAADPTLIIARLPLNTDIDIVVNRGADIVAARTIHTSSVSSGTGTGTASEINPAAHDCTSEYYKKDPPIADVAASAYDFLNRISTPSETQALAYYKSIGAITDANGNGIFEISEGEDFAHWKTRNGFNAGDDEHASYFNAGDLGFHRAMHQKTTGTHVAFYVSNYGNNTDAENDVFLGIHLVPNATVAMEYDINTSIPGTRGIIKFFLFKGPLETLETHVNLDGNGEKFIPGLCIECHGGRETDYTALPAGTGLQSYYQMHPEQVPTFLAFDAQSFTYFTDHPIGTQQTNLRNLNQKVYDANATQAIKDFLDAAYSSSGTLAGNFIDNSTAVNWVAGSTNTISNIFFYSRVVGPSCRTCHASKSANPFLQFNAPEDFSTFPVCGASKYMPNAKVTFINFWTSSNPYQPEQLRLFAGDEHPCE